MLQLLNHNNVAAQNRKLVQVNRTNNRQRVNNQPNRHEKNLYQCQMILGSVSVYRCTIFMRFKLEKQKEERVWFVLQIWMYVNVSNSNETNCLKE